MLKQINNLIKNHTFKLLLVCLIMLRLITVMIYGAISIFRDSEDYIYLGKLLSQFNLENHPGSRTPGFPLLIAISDNKLIITIIIQLVLGVLGSCVFYDLIKIKVKSKVFAFWSVLCVNLFVHFIFFEFAILTESLCVFLMILTFWYTEKFNLLESNTASRHYFILSLILSWLYLTKPLFIYLPIGFAVFNFTKSIITKQKTVAIILKTALILIVPLVSFCSWNMLNKRNIGDFTSTYYLGINLSQVATTFFDKAPEEDKLIRDIFVKHRDSIKQIKPNNLPMSVWFAHKELLEKTKLNNQNLSNELGRISKNLFRKHPDLYATQVLISWSLFWGYGESLLINEEKFNNKYFKYFVLVVWYIERYLLIIFNILFLVFCAKKLFLFFRTKCKTYDFDLLLICIVLSGSLAQALVVYGSNSRFAFPFLPLIVYFVLLNLKTFKLNKNHL